MITRHFGAGTFIIEAQESRENDTRFEILEKKGEFIIWNLIIIMFQAKIIYRLQYR